MGIQEEDEEEQEQQRRRARLWRSSLGEVREMEKKLAAMEGRLQAAARERLPVLEAAAEPVAAIATAASSFTSHLDSAIARTSSLLRAFSSIRSLQAQLSSLDPRLDLPDFLHLLCSMEASLAGLPELYRSSLDLLHLHTLPSLRRHSHLLDPSSLEKLAQELARSKRLSAAASAEEQQPLQEILASRKPLDKALLKLEAEFERLLTDNFRVVDLRAMVQDPAEEQDDPGDGAADLASDDADEERSSSSSSSNNSNNNNNNNNNNNSNNNNNNNRDRGRRDLAAAASGEDPRHSAAAAELLDPDTVNKILVISDRLKANGRMGFCLDAYKQIRVKAARKSMATLGLGYLASFSARKLEEMKWEEIEEGVNRWGRDVGAIVGVLMAGERELCERALRNLGAADRAACFADIAAQSNMAVFFRYARAVAGTRHRPEALLVGLLELLRGLSASKTGIAAVFRGCPDVLRSVGEAKRALAQNAARALGELAASVEAKMAPVPGDGGKDRSASFVVNYMGMVVRDYKPAMEEALSLYRQQSQGQGAQSGFGPLPIMCSSLKNAALGMMGALERSLEQRARSHPDPALAHLFLMNNCRHVLARLKECVGLADCLGDEFKLAWRRKVELNMRSYIKRSWEPVISSLSRDGLHHHSSGSVNAGLVARRVAAFHQAFERVCWVQANWVVLDDLLRENLYLSVLQLLSPAYHNFVQLYASYLEQDDGVPKYTAEMLENRVRNLFRGGR